MTLRENIPLSVLTTLKVGGDARYVAECVSVEDVQEALAFAKGKNIPFFPLGEGSNVLAPDAGYEGLIIHMRLPDLVVEGDGTLIAGAGVIWDQVVRQAGLRGLWGIENLAGIPGTMGAAPVQNIGAYGAELADTLIYVDALDANTGEALRISKDACDLGYRDSRFKRERQLLITSVALKLSANGEPRVSYKDLAARKEAGDSLATPKEIADVVRSVRSVKFPDLSEHGTAGSFFKNPVVPTQKYEELAKRFPSVPGFEVEQGVKIPLAWLLDNVLALRGFSIGSVSLFERQPLVLVTDTGARAHDVDALAELVAQKVFEETKICIEREVRSLT